MTSYQHYGYTIELSDDQVTSRVVGTVGGQEQVLAEYDSADLLRDRAEGRPTPRVLAQRAAQQLSIGRDAPAPLDPLPPPESPADNPAGDQPEPEDIEE